MSKDVVIVVGTALAALLIAACLYSYFAPDQLAQPTPSGEEHQVTVTILDSGAYAANAPTRKNFAIFSEEGLQMIWEMIYGDEGPALPEIDFPQEYVIAVFAGEKQTGGHSIAVASIVDKDDTRTVEVALTKPGGNCATTQAITSPYQIVIVPMNGTVSFARNDSEVIADCK
jgi:hypothetical protein